MQNVNFTVDKDKCIKCGLCKEDCPINIIKMDKYPEMVTGKMECLECQHCFAVCPTGAVSILGNKADEKSLNFDDPIELKNIIKTRRSIRQYKDENIDKGIIADLCKTALHAPTAKNLMDTHFSVIDDKAVLDKFRNKVYEKMSTASIDEPAYAFLNLIIDNWKKTGKDKLFAGAPHLIAASAPADSICLVSDPVIALSYFELLANSMGIGTLWNGILTRIFNDMFPIFRQDLGIPEGNKIGYVMVFGKPNIKYHRLVSKDPTNINVVSFI